MPTHSYLASLVGNLVDIPVLCVGDCMLDRFVYGEVLRISPEAPIPILRIRKEEMMLGGAGNVVRNMAALKVRPFFLSAVGGDSAGVEITTLLGEQKNIAPRLMVEHGRQTTVKTRYIASGQQLLRTDHETLAELSEKTVREFLRQAETLMPSVKALALSDYGKGILTLPTLRQLIGMASSQGIPIIVDPKGADYRQYRGATLIKPNRKELAEASSMPVETNDDIIAAARFLICECGIGSVLVTRSQDGMTLVTANEFWHLPAEARDVFDVSGAGDTVLAVIASAMAANIPILEACRLANTAAGIVVGKVGTAVVYPDDLVAELHSDDLTAGNTKILSLEAAFDRIAIWRSKGLRIGFTNGCFDLLHPGHISLLAQARSLCDRLVVGLNSDESVVRLKGPSRPVQSEAARATVLASLETTDIVVLFGDDTPLELIKVLQPDVLVKGADYTVSTVVGADVVQDYGGQVFLATLEDGFSTTNTIARLKS